MGILQNLLYNYRKFTSGHITLDPNPKGPYQYSLKDKALTANDIEANIYSIQEQLEEDARNVEEILKKKGAMYFYGYSILRVKLPPTENGAEYGVLNRQLRIDCLRKNLKIPFTVNTKNYDDGYETIISYIYNCSQIQEKPSESVPAPIHLSIS